MFCIYCGTEFSDHAVFCTHCGKPRSEQQSDNAYRYMPPTDEPISAQKLIKKYSLRIKIESILWGLIGSYQILLGRYDESWWTMIIGVLNLLGAISSYRFSEKVLKTPKGIIERERSLVMPSILLIYHLVISGPLGVILLFYYLIWIRGFVMKHESQFKAIEENIQQNQP